MCLGHAISVTDFILRYNLLREHSLEWFRVIAWLGTPDIAILVGHTKPNLLSYQPTLLLSCQSLVYMPLFYHVHELP